MHPHKFFRVKVDFRKIGGKEGFEKSILISLWSQIRNVYHSGQFGNTPLQLIWAIVDLGKRWTLELVVVLEMVVDHK